MITGVTQAAPSRLLHPLRRVSSSLQVVAKYKAKETTNKCFWQNTVTLGKELHRVAPTLYTYQDAFSCPQFNYNTSMKNLATAAMAPSLPESTANGTSSPQQVFFL